MYLENCINYLGDSQIGYGYHVDLNAHVQVSSMAE